MKALSNEMSSQEWRQLVHTPVPSVDHDFTKGAVAAICMYADNAQANLVASLSRDNDIKSLKVFLEHPVYATGARDLSFRERETICYSVAHMLVDGGNNVEFAKEWMEHFGHTQDKTAERIRTLLKAPGPTLQEMQHILGLISVAPNPFKQIHQGDTQGPPLEQLLNAPQGMNFEANYATAQFHLLREAMQMHSPFELPDLVNVTMNIEMIHGGSHTRVSGIEDKTPLAHAMWENKNGASRFLQVVEDAYGLENPTVVAQMRAGFNAALEGGKLRLCESPDQDQNTLKVIAQGWMEPAEVEKMWLAQYIVSKREGSVFAERHVDFCEMVGHMASRSPETVVRLVETMSGQGVDMGKRLIRTFGFDRNSYGLLDVAVDQTCPELYVALLAAGADPTRPNWKSFASNPRTREPSAIEKIEQLITQLESTKPDDRRLPGGLIAMQDASNAWRAQKAAREALAELDLGMAVARP